MHTLHTSTYMHTLQSQAHSSHLNSQADSPHLHSQEHSPHLHSQKHSTHRQTLHITHIGTLTTHPLTNSDTLSLYSHIHTPDTSTLSYILAILLLMEILSMSLPLATFPTFTNTQPRIVSHCQIRCKVC